jgi:CBS domain-containing protein
LTLLVPGALPQEIVCADRRDTLGELLEKLVTHRLHRLYVVDFDTRPVGIITLTDILRKLVELCQ